VDIDLYSLARKLSSLLGSRKAAKIIERAIIEDPGKYLSEALIIYHKLDDPKARAKLKEILLSLLLTNKPLRQTLISMIIDNKLEAVERELAIEILGQIHIPIKKYLENQVKIKQLVDKLVKINARRAAEQLENEKQNIEHIVRYNIVEAIKKQKQLMVLAKRLLALFDERNKLKQMETIVKLNELLRDPETLTILKHAGLALTPMDVSEEEFHVELIQARKRLKRLEETPLESNSIEEIEKIIRKVRSKLPRTLELESLWIIEDQETSIPGLDWSPDGRYIVIGTGNGWLKVYDAETGKYLWGLKLRGEVKAVDWSPSGKYIAAINHNRREVFVIDANTHDITWSSQLDPWTCDVSWNPNGEYLAVGTRDYLYLFDKDGEQLWRSERQLFADVSHIVWNHKGDKIAFRGGLDGLNVVVYRRTGRKLWEYTTGLINSLDWSPDDQYLAVGSYNNYVYVFDYKGNLMWKKNMKKQISNVAWNTSGEYLAVSGKFGTALFTKAGKQLWIKDHIETLHSGSLKWSKHGYLVIGGKDKSTQQYKLFILDTEGNILTSSEDLTGYTHRIAWSPDQTRIAAVGEYGKLYVFGFPPMDSVDDIARCIRVLVNSCERFIDEGRFIGASSILGKVSDLCARLSGISSLQRICSRAKELQSLINSLYTVLNNIRIEAYPTGEENVYRFVIIAENTLNKVVDGLYVEFRKDEIKDYLTLEGDYRIKFPPLRPDMVVEKEVIVKVLISGRIIVPYRACIDNLCIDREFVLKTRIPRKILATAEVIEAQRSRETVPLTLSVSLEELASYLAMGVGSLSEELVCSGEWFKTELFSGLVPGRFIGIWSCCRLGCGGWSCSYLCQRNGESIVVKIPRGYEDLIEGGAPPSVSGEQLNEIKSKAEIILGLRHPNILRLLGVGAKAPVLIYEYADYGTLDWQLRRGWKPSMKDLMLMFLQIADALRYIHGRGLVHGDVKPNNIFFVDKVAKIGDFSGLKELLSRMSTKTSTSETYTIKFRAPEQVYSDLRIEAERLGLEHMVDIYGLGNTILYTLTGASIDGAEAIKPGVVDEVVQEISNEDLRELVRRMLDPKPWNRPGSLEVVRSLLTLLKEM